MINQFKNVLNIASKSAVWSYSLNCKKYSTVFIIYCSYSFNYKECIGMLHTIDYDSAINNKILVLIPAIPNTVHQFQIHWSNIRAILKFYSRYILFG